MCDYYDPTPAQAEAARRMFAKLLWPANDPLEVSDWRADLRLMGACLRAVCGPVQQSGR